MAYERIWIAVMVALFLSLMPALAWIDIEHRIISNRITYPAFLGVQRLRGGRVALRRRTDPMLALGGALLYGGLLFVVALVSRGMGMGDVKLALVIGSCWGRSAPASSASPPQVRCSSAGSGDRGLDRGQRSQAMIPFRPYMAAGAVVGAFWGEPIADWYLRSFSATLL